MIFLLLAGVYWRCRGIVYEFEMEMWGYEIDCLCEWVFTRNYCTEKQNAFGCLYSLVGGNEGLHTYIQK